MGDAPLTAGVTAEAHLSVLCKPGTVGRVARVDEKAVEFHRRLRQHRVTGCIYQRVKSFWIISVLEVRDRRLLVEARATRRLSLGVEEDDLPQTQSTNRRGESFQFQLQIQAPKRRTPEQRRSQQRNRNEGARPKEPHGRLPMHMAYNPMQCRQSI